MWDSCWSPRSRPTCTTRRRSQRLAAVARRIAPTLGRLADPDRPDVEPHPETGVIDALAAATRLAHTPRGFARGASAALDRLIPHERLDIFVPGASPEQVYRLSAHEDGGLWSDSSLIVPRDLLDPSAAFAGADVVLLADALMEAGWTGWAESDRNGAVRSALGVRLVVAERVVGYLLLGGDTVGVYDAHDAELLNRLAPWIASRVEALVQSHQLKIIRAQLGSANAIPTQLRRMATILATVPDFSTGAAGVHGGSDGTAAVSSGAAGAADRAAGSRRAAGTGRSPAPRRDHVDAGEQCGGEQGDQRGGAARGDGRRRGDRAGVSAAGRRRASAGR